MTTTSLSTTAKAVGLTLLAALLSAALFSSPISSATAQEDEAGTEQEATEAPDDQADDDADDDADDERVRGDDLTDEEREALRAEREAQRAAQFEQFADELGVSTDEVTAAARTVLQSSLADRVADGDIAQARADEILDRFDEEGDTFGLFGGGHGRGHGPRGH